MKKHFCYISINIVLLLILTLPVSLFGQFGKNKVQYQNFNWKYLQSRHFDIYYYDGGKYLAEFTAIEAERALASIENTLNYKLPKRVSIIVYQTHNEFQQTNVIAQFMPEGVGGVTELYKNRVVVPFQGNYAQFRHVIHHELVHSVLNNMFYGGTVQTAIGSGSLNIQFPLWMNEGICEFESNGGYNTLTDMFMRDVSLSENLKGLKNLNGYYAYRGGQAFYWYVAENYGKEKVGDLINRLRIVGNVDGAFKSSFNMSLDDFSDKFNLFFKRYYFPDIEQFANPIEFAERITNAEKDRTFYNSSPAISPDGKKMAYISAPSGIFGIYVLELDKKGAQPQRLVSSSRMKDFEDLNILTPGISWNPQSNKIAISAKAGGEDAIYIVNAINAKYDRITLGLKSISSVVWSPDGKKLAFTGSSSEASDLFTYDIQSGKLANITRDIFSDESPVWSPDSKFLYFISDRGEHINTNYNRDNFIMWSYDYNRTDVYSIEIESGIIQRLTFTPEYSKTSIAVSGDNQKLLYTSDMNGIYNVYVLDNKTLQSRPLTNSISGISQLSLSPDGRSLLMATQIDGAYDIFKMNFPFEKDLGLDSLPKTKFRSEMEEKRRTAEKIAELALGKDIQKDEGATLPDYGEFEIEFSRQEIVRPNPDALDRAYSPATTQGIAAGEGDTSFIEKDYKISFSPDLVLGNPGFSSYWGFQGVAQMLFSDVLGDHQIYFLAHLLTDLRNSTFFLAYNYLPDQIDYSIEAYHSAGYLIRRNSIDGDNSLYRFRYWGASVLASYPFDFFNRIEWRLRWMNTSKENTDITVEPSVSQMLFVPEARYVHDNVLYNYFYSPERGSRYYVGFKGVPKFSKSGRGFLTAKADYRTYLPVIDNFLTIALRGSAGSSFGPDPTNFFLGGIESWINADFKDGYLPFDDPVDFAFMQVETPLRGWPINQINGRNFFISNLELRFPIIVAVITGPLPIFMQGALFYDIGGAWNDTFISSSYDETGRLVPNNLLMSTGVGIRSFIFGLPLKIDVAWRNNYYAWSQPFWLFSLGLDW